MILPQFLQYQADENDGIFISYTPCLVIFGGIRAEKSDITRNLNGDVGN